LFHRDFGAALWQFAKNAISFAHPRGRGSEVRFWHKADKPTAPAFVRYWGNSGQIWIMACDDLSAFDPTATLAVHCGNGFDADFSPYQSARLSR
jgi:hypothetical protein